MAIESQHETPKNKEYTVGVGEGLSHIGTKLGIKLSAITEKFELRDGDLFSLKEGRQGTYELVQKRGKREIQKIPLNSNDLFQESIVLLSFPHVICILNGDNYVLKDSLSGAPLTISDGKPLMVSTGRVDEFLAKMDQVGRDIFRIGLSRTEQTSLLTSIWTGTKIEVTAKKDSNGVITSFLSSLGSKTYVIDTKGIENYFIGKPSPTEIIDAFLKTIKPNAVYARK